MTPLRETAAFVLSEEHERQLLAEGVSMSLLKRLRAAGERHMRRVLDGPRQAVDPRNARRELRGLSRALSDLERAYRTAHPDVKGFMESDWERRHRGSTHSLESWLAEVPALRDRTNNVLAWTTWSTKAKPGPRADAARWSLYEEIAVALDVEGVRVTDYPNGRAARILRVIVHATTGNRLGSGNAIRKPLQYMQSIQRQQR